MAGMFEELYKDPLAEIEESARKQAALGGWGTIASSAGLAGGMLGRAGSKALGATYEEDLVSDILKQGDHETAEGRAAVLSQLSQVSPGAFMKVQGMYQELESGKLKLAESKFDFEQKKDAPAKAKQWRTKVLPNFIQDYALNKSGLNVTGIKTEADFTKAVNKAIEQGMDKTIAKNTLSAFKDAVKKANEAWKATPYDPEATTQTKVPSTGDDPFAKYSSTNKPELGASDKSKAVDPNPSFVDTYVNKPTGDALAGLAESGLTVGEYLSSGEAQHDLLGKDISNAINQYINKPISDLFK